MIRKKDIEQIYYIEKEIEMWQKTLNELQDFKTVQSPVLDGMPRAQIKSDPTGQEGSRLADDKQRNQKIKETIDKIKKLNKELSEKRIQIIEYITTLDDSLMRMIIMHRCVDRMSWKEVALRVGGGNTEANVRLKFFRHFETIETK